MNIKWLTLFLLVAVVQLNAAELSGNIIKVETSGAKVNAIKWDNVPILSGVRLLLQSKDGTLWGDSGPNTAVRLYENDAEYLKLDGTIKRGGDSVVAYQGKIRIENNNTVSVSIDGEFLQSFSGIFSCRGWLDFDLLSGRPLEYLPVGADKAISRTLPDKASDYSTGGCDQFKLALSDNRSISIISRAGKISLGLWKWKDSKQPFAFDAFMPGKKVFVAGEKFKIEFVLKFETQTITASRQSRNPVSAAVFQSQPDVPVTAMNLSSLVEILDFSGLTGISVTDASGNKIISQLEDQNLNGIIDRDDALVFRHELIPGRWNQLTLIPEFSTQIKLFKELSMEDLKSTNIVFSNSGNSYKLGFESSENFNLAVSIPNGLLPDTINAPPIKPGTYFQNGPVRCRISHLQKQSNKTVYINAFTFDKKLDTINYSGAFYVQQGSEVKISMNIKKSDFGNKYNAPLIAYACGGINYFKDGESGYASSYGDWLSGLYAPGTFKGITLGSLNNDLENNSWVANAGFNINGLSLFLPGDPGSFRGTAQISMVENKNGFEQALARCRNRQEWVFQKKAEDLNSELQAETDNVAKLLAHDAILFKSIVALEQNGLYAAGIKSKFETAESYFKAAKYNLGLGRAICSVEMLKKSAKLAAQAGTMAATVSSEKLKLPLPPTKNKFIIGVCGGSCYMKPEKEFLKEYCTPDYYRPLTVVGLNAIHFHSFEWQYSLENIAAWVKTVKALGLEPYPQLAMALLSEATAKEYPYYSKWNTGWPAGYVIRHFSPVYMSGYKDTDQFTKSLQDYYREAGKFLSDAGAAGFFGVNEPVVMSTEYNDTMRDAFLYGFRNYLDRKYADIKQLNVAWKSDFQSFEQVQWDNQWLNQNTETATVGSENGSWQFKADPGNAGLIENWQKVQPANCRNITVPGYWEKQIPEMADYNGVAWYFRSINLPEGEIMLYFGGIDDNATVFYNGNKIGENRGYNREFKVKIPGGSSGLLAVRVDDERGDGGIYKDVAVVSATSFPYFSRFAYPARNRDYYEFRNQVNADFASMQTDAIREGAPDKIAGIKEWTGDLSYLRNSKYSDPFYISKASRGGYTVWDCYSNDSKYLSYHNMLRQSVAEDKPSILGETGIRGGGSAAAKIGSGAIQKPFQMMRYFGYNLRGIYFFAYNNWLYTALLERDFSIPDNFVQMGALSKTIKNMPGVLDSLMISGEIALYCSKNDLYCGQENMVFNQLYSLFGMFFSENTGLLTVDASTFQKRMPSIKLLILPSAPFLAEKEWLQIEKFRKNGGTVLAYANSGLMEINNTRRPQPLLPVKYQVINEKNTLKGLNLAINYHFDMETAFSQVLLLSDSNKALVGMAAERLYISNIDLGRVYEDTKGSSISRNIWQQLQKIISQAGVIQRVTADFPVQLQVNQLTGDTFIFVPAEENKRTNMSIKVRTHGMDNLPCKDVIFDYFNLVPAKIQKEANGINIFIPEIKADENGIWHIGRISR